MLRMDGHGIYYYKKKIFRTMKQYLILRDNSVSGPFPFEITIDKSLTEQDLIWVENESKAWIKAKEVQELEAFVQQIDEDIILQRREERIRIKKGNKSLTNTLNNSTDIATGIFNPGGSTVSGEVDTSFRYKAPHFKERISSDNVKIDIWQKPEYKAASLWNVTLVLLVVSLGAFIIRQLVENYENNLKMVSGKDFPVKKNNHSTGFFIPVKNNN